MKKRVGIPLLALMAGFATFMVFFTNPVTNAAAGDETCVVTDLASAVSGAQVETSGTVERKVLVLDQPEGS